MEARGIYWLIVALYGITPEEIEDIPDAFGAAGDAAQPWPTPRGGGPGAILPPGPVRAAARPPEAFSRGENTCVFLS